MKTKQIKKGLLSVVLSLALVLSLIPAVETKADCDSDTITVYVTVSDKGALATAADGSYVANVPVTIAAEDATLDDAMKALHETYYSGGAEGYGFNLVAATQLQHWL